MTGGPDATRLERVELALEDDRPVAPELEQERRVAIYDLVEASHFGLPGTQPGPYALLLGRAGNRLSFALSAAGQPAARFELGLGPLRQVVKDYAAICSDYYEAVRTARASEIEALDDVRRAIHHEGAHLLSEQLQGKAVLDAETARRLFTLIYTLAI